MQVPQAVALLWTSQQSGTVDDDADAGGAGRDDQGVHVLHAGGGAHAGVAPRQVEGPVY